MNLPFSVRFKRAKQGGCILETTDSHEFKKSLPTQGKKLVMKWVMHGCMATSAVNIEENMVVRLLGVHIYDTHITLE